MKLDLTILLTALLLVSLSYPALAGTSLQGLSKTFKIADMDEYMKAEAKRAEEGLARYASSALSKQIVTIDRVRLMKSMKQNKVFIMTLASQMRHEFDGKELDEYDDNVRVVLRYAETQARDSKSLDRVLNILDGVANASSAVGSSVFSSSTTITRMRP